TPSQARREPASPAEGALEGRPRLVAEDGEDDTPERPGLEAPRLLDHDPRALVEREAADAGPDGGQRERGGPELVRDAEAARGRPADEVGVRPQILSHHGAVE